MCPASRGRPRGAMGGQRTQGVDWTGRAGVVLLWYGMVLMVVLQGHSEYACG